MSNLDNHELQILFTKIVRDKNGEVQFTTSEFQVNDKRYFYPASTVKLPVAILALQKINELNQQGIAIEKNTPFVISQPNDTTVIAAKDSTSLHQTLTIGHLIKRIFLVSDNEAYNYLFDFLGRDYINNELKKRGFVNSQIMHKFLVGADNVNTWTYSFYNDGALVYMQPSIQSISLFDKTKMISTVRGKGYLDNENKLVNEPFDFREKNSISIKDLDQLNKTILFPEAVNESYRFDLTKSDYEFLRYWMSRTPSESEYPNYNVDQYHDSYVKFVMFGDSKKNIPKAFRSYNKVGYAYGTLTETTYIENLNSGVEFMLTVTLLVNENEIYNDGIYEYDEIGIPFLTELGKLLYDQILKEK
jgi:hypothetical protein